MTLTNLIDWCDLAKSSYVTEMDFTDPRAKEYLAAIATSLRSLEAQSDEVLRLKGALETYGRHLADCNYVVLGARPIVCTCGYQAALGSQP